MRLAQITHHIFWVKLVPLPEIIELGAGKITASTTISYLVLKSAATDITLARVFEDYIAHASIAMHIINF